jgi:hypothetical protein
MATDDRRDAGGPQPEAGGEAGASEPDRGPVSTTTPVPGSNCMAEIVSRGPDPGIHMTVCSALSHATNPPSSGPHYPQWAAFKTYPEPVPWGFLVHSLEHGALVISYNCPGGCPSEVAEVQSFIDGLPLDPLCTSPPRRLILVPDPNLDVRFAASAWGFALRAGCFERQTFEDFFLQHYGKAPEDFCNAGVDLSASGWCP